MMDIVEFFDPHDKKHIQAWWSLQSGEWPKYFKNMWPDDIEITINWEWRIRNKICEAWVDHILIGN